MCEGPIGPHDGRSSLRPLRMRYDRIDLRGHIWALRRRMAHGSKHPIVEVEGNAGTSAQQQREKTTTKIEKCEKENDERTVPGPIMRIGLFGFVGSRKVERRTWMGARKNVFSAEAPYEPRGPVIA